RFWFRYLLRYREAGRWLRTPDRASTRPLCWRLRADERGKVHRIFESVPGVRGQRRGTRGAEGLRRRRGGSGEPSLLWSRNGSFDLATDERRFWLRQPPGVEPFASLNSSASTDPAQSVFMRG